MATFQNAAGSGVLKRMISAIQENKAHLGEIDGLIGDGDHGMNMNKGFTLYQEELADQEVSLSNGLYDLGQVLFNKIGGSMGPIYGTLFMEMSDQIENAESIDLKLFADMLKAGLAGLYEIIDARPGDKTLVDSLHPAIESLEESIKADKSFGEALESMKGAAQKGRDATIDMVAKFGRSSRLGERSRGVLDAGATSCSLILCAMADGMLSELQ
jgi:dihydroxyacetone kinase-like protein